MSTETESKPADKVIDPPKRDAREAQIAEMNERLQKIEETRSGENIRLFAMFILGVSAGISLTLLWMEIARKFF